MIRWGVVIWGFLFLAAGLSVCYPAAGEEVVYVGVPIQNQVVIFSGAIPAGDGNVSIRATSGNLYQIPTMTPLGVIQALAGTGMINSYKIGDSLLGSRGIFTLDAVNEHSVTGTEGWFVQVNGVGLREYSLPAREGLNTYPLKNGDIIVFAYGDPTSPVTSARSVIRVQVGEERTYQEVSTGQTSFIASSPVTTSQPVVSAAPVQGAVQQILPDQQVIVPMQIPVMTPLPTPQVVTNVIPLTAELTPAPEQTIVQGEAVLPPQIPLVIPSPVPVAIVPIPVETELPLPPSPVPSQVPVQVEQTPVITPVPTELPPPVPTTEIPTQEPTPLITIQPTPQPTEITPEPTPSPEPTPEMTPVPEPTKVNERVIFDGTIDLPDGIVNVTANSGVEYEIEADTPLGIINQLKNDDVITSLSISDKGMRKGGILIIDGIEDKFFSGSKTWFTQVNSRTLQEYYNSKFDGLNIYQIASGDTVAYYYGNPSDPISLAESVIMVRIA